MKKTRILYVDFSGMPTGACIAAVAVVENGRIEGAFQRVALVTTSQGEFLGILLALQYAKSRRWTRILVRSDSTEAVGVAQKDTVGSNRLLADYHTQMQVLKSDFAEVRFEWVARDRNIAHAFAQAASQGFLIEHGNAGLDALLQNGGKPSV